MKMHFVPLTALLALASLVPANAQSVAKNSAGGGKMCWTSVDSGRPYGFWDVCTDQKNPELINRQRGRSITNNIDTVVTIDQNNGRDSGGGSGGGGGGGGGGNGR